MKTKVTQERMNKILLKTQFSTQTVFEKCTVVTAKLPNGFVIT